MSRMRRMAQTMIMARISVSQVVQGLVLDALSGRTPLFRLQDSLTEQTAEVLLGQAVAAKTFADHNVGRVLDKRFETVTSKIFSEIAQKAVEVFEIDPSYVHGDTTSVSLYGDYDCIDPPFRIEHGHSKDKRPDLKQFLVKIHAARAPTIQSRDREAAARRADRTSKIHSLTVAALSAKKTFSCTGVIVCPGHEGLSSPCCASKVTSHLL